VWFLEIEVYDNTKTFNLDLADFVEWFLFVDGCTIVVDELLN